MRASSSDATVVLRPPQNLSLDQSIEFIADDELIGHSSKDKIEKNGVRCKQKNSSLQEK